MGMQKHPPKPSGRHAPQRVNARPQVTSPQDDIYGFEMDHSPSGVVFTEVNEGNEERLRSSLTSLPSVTNRAVESLLGCWRSSEISNQALDRTAASQGVGRRALVVERQSAGWRFLVVRGCGSAHRSSPPYSHSSLPVASRDWPSIGTPSGVALRSYHCPICWLASLNTRKALPLAPAAVVLGFFVIEAQLARRCRAT